MIEQKPQDLKKRTETLGKWAVRITSYQLGNQFICTVDNVDPGATIARAQAELRDQAEIMALNQAKAAMGLGRT